MKKATLVLGLMISGSLLGCSRNETQNVNTQAVADPIVSNANSTNGTNITPSWPDSLDAMVAAPGNHKVILENDKVRVLDVTVSPGEREPVHGHRWPSVLYVMAEENIRDYDASGKLIYDTKTDVNPMKAPYTIWMEPQAPHAVENLGKKPLRLLRVELKQ